MICLQDLQGYFPERSVYETRHEAAAALEYISVLKLAVALFSEHSGYNRVRARHITRLTIKPHKVAGEMHGMGFRCRWSGLQPIKRHYLKLRRRAK